MRTFRALWPVLLAAAAFYAAGLGWGLPSKTRVGIVFSPEQQSDPFYRALEDNRRAMYDRIGLNIAASYGRGDWNGEMLPSTAGFQLIRYPAGSPPDSVLMHGYSSFLLRSVEQDEQFTLNAISRFRPRHFDFNSHQTSNGGAFLYPVAAFFAALHVAHYTHLVSDPLYYYRNPDELARLFKAGRLFSLLCGLGCVIMVFLIGRRLYDERVGWWSAALFGLTPLMVAYTHIMKPHVPGTFLSLWCLLYCIEGALSQKPREFFKASLLFGLAVSAAKYCWILAFPMWICWFLAHKKKPSPRQFLTMVGWNLLAIAVFCATNPYAVLDWRDLLAEMHAESGWYQSSLNPAALFHLMRQPMRLGLGSAWLLGLCGLAGTLHRRGAAENLLLLMFLPLIAGISFLVSSAAGTAATIRFCLCPCALLVILATGWVLKQSPWRATPWPARALAGVLAFNVGLALLYDANFLADSLNLSNNFEAGRWIERNIPKGSALGLSTPAPMLDRFPPLRFSNYELVYFNNGPMTPAAERALPEFYVTRARALSDLPENVARHYDLVNVFDRLSWRGWSFEDPFTSANFPVALLSKKVR